VEAGTRLAEELPEAELASAPADSSVVEDTPSAEALDSTFLPAEANIRPAEEWAELSSSCAAD